MTIDQKAVEQYINQAIEILNKKGLYPNSWEGRNQNETDRIEIIVIEVAKMIQLEELSKCDEVITDEAWEKEKMQNAERFNL